MRAEDGEPREPRGLYNIHLLERNIVQNTARPHETPVLESMEIAGHRKDARVFSICRQFYAR